MRINVFWIGLILAGFILSTAAHGQACIEDLDALTDLSQVMSPHVITPDGLGYAGAGHFATGEQVSFFWNQAGGLRTTASDQGVQVLGTSRTGRFVIINDRTGWRRWDTSSGTVRTISFPDSVGTKTLVRVTTTGQVYANGYDESGRIVYAWRWTESAGLAPLREDPFLLAGVSHDGSVRVGSDYGEAYLEPYIWRSGEWERMEGFPDENELRVSVTHLSGDGTYASGEYVYPTDEEGMHYRAAFRWRNDEVESIPGAGVNVIHYVSSVTDDGVVIVESLDLSEDDEKQVMWTGGTVLSVYDVVVESGLDPDFVELALGVRADGQGGRRIAISDDGTALYATTLLSPVRLSGGCAKGVVGYFSPGLYPGGTELDLFWLVSGIDGSVSVEFSPDGEDYEFIGSAPAYNTNVGGGNHNGGFVEWTVPHINTTNAYLRFSASGAEDVIGPFIIRCSDSSCSERDGLVEDLRFAGGVIRPVPFEGVSAVLSQAGSTLEIQHTDESGNYVFSELEEGTGYDFRITDTEIYAVERTWSGLTPSGVHRAVRLPSSMLSRLDALADSLAVTRRYDVDAVRALIEPYEAWAGADVTSESDEVEIALARLIIAHEAIETMYDNTVPVSKELATGLAELTGFALSFARAWRSINSTVSNRNLPIALSRRFQGQTETYAASAVFNAITSRILAVMPSSPPELRSGLNEARAVIHSEMARSLSGGGFDVFSLIRGAALRIGKEIGDDLLMDLFKNLTQDDLDGGVARAAGFATAGETRSAWQAVSEAGIENFTASDDAASFSLLTRGTASDIEGISGVAGGFIRLVALARILRVAQLAGYVVAVGRTGYQFYDTISNDLPHAVDLAFDPAAQPPGSAPALREDEPPALRQHESPAHLPVAAGGRRSTPQSEALQEAIEAYQQVVDEMVALAQTGDEDAFIEALSDFLDAADAVKTAASNAQLSILAVAEDAGAQVAGYLEADSALAATLVHSAAHHLALSAYALGYLDGEAAPADLASQADTTHASFAAVVPQLEAVSALVADQQVPPFVAVTDHGISVDSVEAGEPFTLHATIRNGDGAAAENVEVSLVADRNMDVTSLTAFDLGQLAAEEDNVVEWTVAAHDTASVSAYQIRITSTNAKVLPAVGGFVVAGALGVGVEEGSEGELPDRIILEQNYPNPFNPRTTISYALLQAGPVRVVVYDVLGREVRRLVDGTQSAGRHEVVFEAGGLPSGVYVYSLEAGGRVMSRRMLLVK